MKPHFGYVTNNKYFLERCGVNKSNTIYVKRCHGLGNVILLLPVLDHLFSLGTKICLITRKEWVDAISGIRPHFEVIAGINSQKVVVDLDMMTSEIYPSQHRSDELAKLLGVNTPIVSTQIETIPAKWSKPFEHLRGSVIFALEAQHPSRSWPLEHCRRIKGLFPEDQLVLVGTKKEPKVPNDIDLRGHLELTDLFGVISVGKVIITMDSAVLHIAAALKRPTVAIFGGVDARYRIRQVQPVVVLQSKMTCCPCNKHEDCDQRFDCILNIDPIHVRQAVNYAPNIRKYLNYFDLSLETI